MAGEELLYPPTFFFFNISSLKKVTFIHLKEMPHISNLLGKCGGLV